MHVLEWFQAASQTMPSIWRTAGWNLWHLCNSCKQQDGDNRLHGAICTSIGSAALGSGPGDWWAVMRSTVLSDINVGWHDNVYSKMIESVVEAIDSHFSFPYDDLPIIWSLGLAFCCWHDETDNSALRRFREALLSVPRNASERQPLLDALARTSRSNSLDHLPSDEEEATKYLQPESPSATASPSLVREEVVSDEPIRPSVAASVCELASSSSSDRDSRIDSVLIAIGAEYCAEWASDDHDVLSSLEQIARVVTERQLWVIAEAIAKGMDRSEPYRVYGVYPNLFRLALARAKLKGAAELVAGLDPQLEMHARWAGAARPGDLDRPPPLTVDSELTWQSVAARTLGYLLTSNSSDVLTATLEATHALVACRPQVIGELFDECTTEWQRHWLLSAAESWAALYPSHLSIVRPILVLCHTCNLG